MEANTTPDLSICSKLTEWEKHLLTLDMSDVPVRETTADENASQQ